MGYIYKITNKTSGRMYIGQTKNNPKKRWKQHRRASRHPRDKDGNSYFYRELRREGTENFFVETIEICPDEELKKREEFWVETLETFKPERGYNTTHGGDNYGIVQTETITAMWDDGYSFTDIVQKTGHSKTSISKVLQSHPNYSKTESKHRGSIMASTVQFSPIIQYDKDGNYLKRFDTPQNAIDYIGNGNYQELAKMCKRDHRMYYGYQWRFEWQDPPGPFLKRADAMSASALSLCPQLSAE